MARLLVMRRDLGPGKHEIGDIVSAFPDDHEFGKYEDPDVWLAAGLRRSAFPAYFAIIDVPGLPVAEVEPFLEAAVEYNDEGEPLVVRRRVWRFRNLNVRRYDRIKSSLSPTQFRAALERK